MVLQQLYDSDVCGMKMEDKIVYHFGLLFRKKADQQEPTVAYRMNCFVI